MNQSRNLLLAAIILLLASSSIAQNSPPAAPPTPAAPVSAIPSYPDTSRGLEKLLGEMMKLAKANDNQTLAAYVKSLALPNPDDWFKSVFGYERGPQYTAASESSRLGIERAIPPTLANLLQEKKTVIVAHRFEGVQSHDILYRALSGHPLHSAGRVSEGYGDNGPSSEGKDGLGNCERRRAEDAFCGVRQPTGKDHAAAV